ncbi:Plug domain-containing protein [soil metagenome]
MKSTFFVAVFVALSNLCVAQDNVSELESIAAPLINSWRAVKNEKVLLETDKKYFLPGETVWFKVYISDSLTNKITYNTKTLFADLVDEKDSVISQVLLHGGSANVHGNILLPDSLPGGFYWLRAYTRKNISENNTSIGLQAIFVADKNNNKPGWPEKKLAVVTGQRKFSADIFPEGGYLISGANSVIGLKVHDQYGQPVAGPGFIKDIRDSVILRFVTNTNGAAKIELTPKFYGRYKVYIEQNGKVDSVGKLPAVNAYAAQLSVVAQSAAAVNLRVLLEDSIFKKNYTTYILAINKDSVCFAAVGKGMYELAIPVADLPGGIVKLLLYNQGKQLVSRRDVFINKKNVNLAITPIRQIFSTRENVKVDIHVEDVNGKPVIAALSVAAISTNLYDNSSSFSTDPLSVLTPADVDLLMLTEQPLNDKSSSTKPIATNQMINIPDTVLELKGKIVNSKNMPVAGEEVLLNSTGGERFYQTEKTDTAGRFSFSLPAFDNGTAFDIQMNSSKQAAKDFKVVVDPFPFPVYATPSGLKEAYWRDAALPGKALLQTLDSLSKMSAYETLQNVTVKAGVVKKQGANSGLITKEMLQTGGMNNLGQAVLRSGKFHLLGSYLITGGSNGFVPAASDEPIVVMDGMPVSVAADGQEVSPVLAYLKTISTNEVEYIKLLTGGEGGSYGVRGGHGVIEIHSATQVNTTSASTPNSSKRILPMGFHVPLAFTMPDYNNKEVKKSKVPDARTTLYWNGELITASNGNAQVNFFTSDVPGSYTINVRGITNTGEQFSGSTTIVVKAY